MSEISLPSSPQHSDLPPSIETDGEAGGDYVPLREPLTNEQNKGGMGIHEKINLMNAKSDILDDSDEDGEVEHFAMGAWNGVGCMCHCKRKCWQQFASDTDQARIIELNQNLKAKSIKDRQDEIFTLVWSQVVDKSGVAMPRKIFWELLGRGVCLPYFAGATGISKDKILSTRKQIFAGHKSAPSLWETKMPSVRDNVSLSKADAWFMRVYFDLAEPMATEDSGESAFLDDTSEAVVSRDHPLWRIAAAHGEHGKVPKKLLNPMGMEEFYALNQLETPDAQVPRATLQRCYIQRWKDVLKPRTQGNCGRCGTCAELTERSKKATTVEEKAEVLEDRKKHITMIKDIRLIDEKGNHTSEYWAHRPSADGAGAIIKLYIDGMDQSKFKCPRNLASNKNFENLWRHRADA